MINKDDASNMLSGLLSQNKLIPLRYGYLTFEFQFVSYAADAVSEKVYIFHMIQNVGVLLMLRSKQAYVLLVNHLKVKLISIC